MLDVTPSAPPAPLDEAARDVLLHRVAQFEGDYWSLNLDGEFEGKFDQPSHDEHGDRIPVPLRRLHPDFAPNPRSKYGPSPGHVGLSFGFVQFTQDGGSLGALLVAMERADPSAFAHIFGPEAGELLRVTNLEGEAVAVPDAASPRGWARRRPRVAPVGGAELWQPPWVERFTAAGQVPSFQRAQRNLAGARYLTPLLEAVARPFAVRSQKGLCILLDRSVQLGPLGCARLLGACWSDPATRALPEPARFRALYERVRVKSWSHRMRKLLDDDGLSFDVAYAL